jgi:hypothetical protein
VFDKIGNMPLHPLVLHAAVVGIPIAALLGFLFVIPWTRNWARWPLALAAVGATAACFVSKQSGEAFERQRDIRPGTPVGDLIAQHSHLAGQLVIIMVVFTVVALANVFVVSRTRTGAVVIVLGLLLVAASVLAGIWVYRVGDIGSRAVWNPTGQALMITLGG